MAKTPTWLHERVNDGYGTPGKHPFWGTVTFERIGDYKIFERDGTWYAYDTLHNAWLHYPGREQAVARAEGPRIDWNA